MALDFVPAGWRIVPTKLGPGYTLQPLKTLPRTDAIMLVPGAAEPIAAAVQAVIDGRALEAARTVKLTSLAANLRAALIAQFESAPLGGQWQFDPLRAGCNAALEKGDLAGAIQGLQDTLTHALVPAPFAPLVTACVTLIETAAPLFAAAAAAGSVDAVNAIVDPNQPAAPAA